MWFFSLQILLRMSNPAESCIVENYNLTVNRLYSHFVRSEPIKYFINFSSFAVSPANWRIFSAARRKTHSTTATNNTPKMSIFLRVIDNKSIRHSTPKISAKFSTETTKNEAHNEHTTTPPCTDNRTATDWCSFFGRKNVDAVAYRNYQRAPLVNSIREPRRRKEDIINEKREGDFPLHCSDGSAYLHLFFFAFVFVFKTI